MTQKKKGEIWNTGTLIWHNPRNSKPNALQKVLLTVFWDAKNVYVTESMEQHIPHCTSDGLSEIAGI